MNNNAYFRFHLAALRSGHSELDCLETISNAGILNAGIGLRHHDRDAFTQRLEEVVRRLKMADYSEDSDEAAVLVGADLVDVVLGGGRPEGIVYRARKVPQEGPLVKMTSEWLWEAIYLARNNVGNFAYIPQKGGISFREFRVLCAILSAQPNRYGFAFIGWGALQARSCGFTKQVDLQHAIRLPRQSKNKLPEYLPPLTRSMIRTTVDRLELLRFFLRFRHSRGKVGGFTAFSFRHGDRDALAADVAEWARFHDGSMTRARRAEDAALALKLRGNRQVVAK